MIFPFISILFVGFVLGLLGGGGSILTVPILIYLFKIDVVTATAYSLFTVGSASSVGAFRNYRKNNLNLGVGINFAIPGLLGVFTSRALIVPSLPQVILSTESLQISKDNLILAVFAIMMILASYSMIFGRNVQTNQKPLSHFKLALLGFTVGVFTGFVGAGGGFILIPVLNSLAGLEIKKAIGTSLFIMSVNSLIGFLGDLLSFQPDWLLLLQLSFLTITGVLVGTYFNSKVPAKVLKKGFGVFVLSLGCWIIYNQVS